MADKVASDAVTNDDAERTLGRIFAIGVPVGTVLGFAGVWVVFSMGPALLVLAGGILLGVIALFWASLRTLSGDAPVAEGLLAVNVAARASSSNSPAEKKRRVMLALKDLKHEHAIRKIDDVDYAKISARYREEAKDLMREADVEIEPMRAKAEEIARAHLAKKGLAGSPASGEPVESVKRARTIKERLAAETEEAGDEGGDAKAPAAEKRAASVNPAEASEAKSARIACHACSVSNEPDATFCKKCGASIQRIDCPKCASSNEPDATFCKKCGASLASPAPTKDSKDATV